jgi:hypothetical protein
MFKGEVKKYYDENNKLPIGIYPIYFLSSYNNVYCEECAMQLINDEYEDIIAYDVNYEDDSLYCEHGHKIDSAYEDNEE